MRLHPYSMQSNGPVHTMDKVALVAVQFTAGEAGIGMRGGGLHVSWSPPNLAVEGTLDKLGGPKDRCRHAQSNKFSRAIMPWQLSGRAPSR